LLLAKCPVKLNHNTGLPVGIASLSAVLKNHGYEVKIFDTAFYNDEKQKSQTAVRSNRMVSKEVINEQKYLPINQSTMEDDLRKTITEFNPDLIGLSILEIMYKKSVQISRFIKKNFKNSLIIAGGIFPTLSPKIVFNETSIDMICLGEGESVIVELCKRIANKKDYIDIDGLWINFQEKIYKNNNLKLHNVNDLPYQDYTEFDERLFYKPMQGRMYKMVNIETSRGCTYNCTYCGAPALRSFYKKNSNGRYFRNIRIDKVISQIQFQIKKHDPEFIYFSSESFLSITEKDFDYFINEYSKIGVPFWIQTRIETITEKRLLKLKEIGMHWLSIGLEHGNEKFRKKILKRNYSNKMFKEKMTILEKLEIGASINNIIGFPFENRGLIFDTIDLNRELLKNNPKLEINVFIFTPYRGCSLYDLCKETGLLEDSHSISSSTLSSKSILNFSKEFEEDLIGLIRTFNLYVRLPKKYYNKIKIAEQPNEEGNIMLHELKEILIDA